MIAAILKQSSAIGAMKNSDKDTNISLIPPHIPMTSRIFNACLSFS